jgi:hypothetical protein
VPVLRISETEAAAGMTSMDTKDIIARRNEILQQFQDGLISRAEYDRKAKEIEAQTLPETSRSAEHG